MFLIRLLLIVHLVCAFSATAAFWVSGVAAKGGAWHRAAGRRFSQRMFAAAATGGVLSLIGLVLPLLLAPGDPGATRQKMTLVLYLLVVIVTPVQHGVAVVAAGPTPMRVRSRAHAILNVVGLIATVLAFFASVAWHAWGLLLVSPAGFIVGLRNMLYASRPVASASDWQREHLTSLLTAGILFHTAFFVLAAARWPGVFGELPWIAVPWLAPFAIGMPVILYLRRTRR